MEFFAELFPGEEGAWMLKLLRRLQGRLGDFNDASVQQKSLLNYWEQKRKGNKVALGLGGLISILYHRQQQTRGLIDQAVEKFCDKKSAADFRHTFKQPASVPVTDVQRTVPQ
jgi:CHAD domain-containing protein